MTHLSVNVNKIAWLRNARGGNNPNLLELSKMIIDSGVSGITVHPRPDLRHITPDDVVALRKLTQDNDVELNIEGNPFSAATTSYPGFMQLILDAKPDQCTFVPDEEHQLTSDHGWDLTNKSNALAENINTVTSMDIRLSLFMDPSLKQIKEAKKIGATRIELYTGPYANDFHNIALRNSHLKIYSDASEYSKSLGMGVNAGHDLDLWNLREFLEHVDVDEVSIGQALISDALINGLEKTTREYLEICMVQ